MKNLVTLLFLVFSFTLGTAQHKTPHSQGVKKETRKKPKRNTIPNKKVPPLTLHKN
jgi:hypothetical protein